MIESHVVESSPRFWLTAPFGAVDFDLVDRSYDIDIIMPYQESYSDILYRLGSVAFICCALNTVSFSIVHYSFTYCCTESSCVHSKSVKWPALYMWLMHKAAMTKYYYIVIEWHLKKINNELQIVVNNWTSLLSIF